MIALLNRVTSIKCFLGERVKLAVCNLYWRKLVVQCHFSYFCFHSETISLSRIPQMEILMGYKWQSPLESFSKLWHVLDNMLFRVLSSSSTSKSHFFPNTFSSQCPVTSSFQLQVFGTGTGLAHSAGGTLHTGWPGLCLPFGTEAIFVDIGTLVLCASRNENTLAKSIF